MSIGSNVKASKYQGVYRNVGLGWLKTVTTEKYEFTMNKFFKKCKSGLGF